MILWKLHICWCNYTNQYENWVSKVWNCRTTNDGNWWVLQRHTLFYSQLISDLMIMEHYFFSFLYLVHNEYWLLRILDRQIYHCPYCNLCRIGKGLGIDYFHCMNCNACMSRSLSVHICREKCFEDNCPICHEYIFTSSSPVKALPCGHLMHSICFQVPISCIEIPKN